MTLSVCCDVSRPGTPVARLVVGGRPCHDWNGMEYEFQRLSLPRTLSRSAVRRMLTDRAEYGGWELARLRLYPDGSRKVELRRRIIRVRATLTREFRPLV